jgi:peptidase inhibitor family I36
VLDWFAVFVLPVLAVVLDWIAARMAAGPLDWRFWYGLLCAALLVGPTCSPPRWPSSSTHNGSSPAPHPTVSGKEFHMKRALTIIVCVLTLIGLTSGVAATAATARDGNCEVGEFCLYWGPGRTGSVSDFNGSIPNYGDTQPTCYEFRKANLSGFQECVKNNATSAWNRTTANTVTVYFNSGYGGRSDVFTPGQAKDLNNTWLENASHRFVHN